MDYNGYYYQYHYNHPATMWLFHNVTNPFSWEWFLHPTENRICFDWGITCRWHCFTMFYRHFSHLFTPPTPTPGAPREPALPDSSSCGVSRPSAVAVRVPRAPGAPRTSAQPRGRGDTAPDDFWADSAWENGRSGWNPEKSWHFALGKWWKLWDFEEIYKSFKENEALSCQNWWIYIANQNAGEKIAKNKDGMISIDKQDHETVCQQKRLSNPRSTLCR